MTAARPAPSVLADQLEALARTIRANGNRPRVMASLLASRGYPTATLGNGAPSSDPTSSTERAALDPGYWVDIDVNLARAERLLWSTGVLVATYHSQILAQASDDDPIPAGTGPCILREICEHICNPRKRPSDRLRRGLCPSHYNRWIYYGQPDLTTFKNILSGEAVA